MKHTIFSKKISATLLVAVALVLVGCFGSKFTLIPPDQAKVNLAYVGDWDAANVKSGDHADMTIRNIDNKFYYVETREKDGKNTERYVGFTAEVKGATFAHLRPMKEDGKIEETWMLMRIALADNKLTLDQLDDDFFKTHPVESAAQLKQVIEQNLNNESMYAKDERIVATKVVAK